MGSVFLKISRLIYDSRNIFYFIQKLRFLSDRATEALAEMEEAGFAEQVARALEQEEVPQEPPEPPEDGGGDGAAEGGEAHGRN